MPVSAGLTRGAFVAKLFVTVVEKFASSPRAAANSFKVSNAPGAESIIALTFVCMFTSWIVNTGFPETVSVI